MMMAVEVREHARTRGESRYGIVMVKGQGCEEIDSHQLRICWLSVCVCVQIAPTTALIV